jgi:excisionase family DNA binding protein
MRPVVIPGPGVFIPAPIAAALAPTLTRTVSEARRAGYYIDPDVMEAVERLVVVGSAWANRHRNVAGVPNLDASRSDEFESISVQQAARQLNVSETAVKARLRRGTLRGVKVGRRWRVDAQTVHAEAECR